MALTGTHVSGEVGAIADDNLRDQMLALAVLRWQPATAYTNGHQVIGPNNEVVAAIGDFTTSSTYDPTMWAHPTMTAIDGGTL